MTPKFIEHIHLDIPKDLTPKVIENGNTVCSVINKFAVQQVEKLDDELCKQIYDIAVSNGIDDVYVLDKKTILSALEKQIPKKVEEWLPFFKAKCPSCNGHIEAHASNLYCCRCGQALDWSDTE